MGLSPPRFERRGLRRRPCRCRGTKPGATGFGGLLTAQLLGAFNDNLFKMIVSMVVVDAGLGGSRSAVYLALVGMLFVAPYFLCSGYAGYLADVLNKRRVIVATKAAEILVMAAAALALLHGGVAPLLGALFLVGVQMTFFSPAKYAILPELFPPHRLAQANGLLEMTRYFAVIAGSAAGSLSIELSGARPLLIGGALVAIAVAGTLAAMRIRPAPDAAMTRSLRVNPLAELAFGARRIWRDHALRPLAIGLTLFEFFATWTVFVVLLFGKTEMGLGDASTGLLAGFAGIGVGVGGLTVGRVAGGRIGLRSALPAVAIMGGALTALPAACGSYLLVASLVTLLGAAAGWVLVLLNASLQHTAERGEKGRVIAANNVLNMAGVMAASVALWILGGGLGLSATWMLRGSGAALLAAAVAAIALRPPVGARKAREPRPGAPSSALPSAAPPATAAGGVRHSIAVRLSAPRAQARQPAIQPRHGPP